MHAPDKPRDLWTDEEFIAAFGEAAKKLPWPMALGALQRPGWTGRISTYLFWCRRCRYSSTRGFTVAHLAGRTGRLTCRSCQARFDLLLPSRRLAGALLNPLSSPRLMMLLLLVGILVAIAASRP
jgi:hypothetical protein